MPAKATVHPLDDPAKQRELLEAVEASIKALKALKIKLEAEGKHDGR
jgi:hypothetical protein